MRTYFKESRGITLIELMVALVISAILIAALYRTFIGQQKTYTVQEQVVDMQQSWLMPSWQACANPRLPARPIRCG